MIIACIGAVSFPFSFALFNVGIVAILVTFFLTRINARDFSSSDPALDLAALIFFIASMLSLFESDYLALSLQGVHKLFRYLLLFIASRELIRNTEDARKIVIALLLGGLISGLDGIGQLVFGEDPLRGRTPHLGLENLLRVTSSFPNPNDLAIYLSFLIPLAFPLIRYHARWNFWVLGAVLIMSAAAFLTYSRAAALALGAGILFLMIVQRNFRILAGLGILACAGFFVLPQSARAWLLALDSWQGFFVDESRILHYKAAWNMLTSSPWFGVGLNTFYDNYAAFRSAGDPFESWSAHNAILHLTAETGVAGLLSFLVFIFLICRLFRNGYRGLSDPFLKACLVGFAGGFLAFFVTGFFESNLWQPRHTYFFWFFTGCACGIAKLSREKGIIQ